MTDFSLPPSSGAHELSMKPENYTHFAQLLQRESGLNLTENKMYLVQSRLLPLLNRNGFKNLDELISHLKVNHTSDLVTQVVESMTTHESFFFRDKKPFDEFKNSILPALLTSKTNHTIRVWCAACSSGQEPYSLAMILDEMRAKLTGWTIEIIATDLSNQIIDKARKGVYTQFEVQRGLPIQYLMKYFTQVEDKWQINDNLRSQIKFQIHNLLNPPVGLGQFDVVYCRNVLIYFDVPTKKKIFDYIANSTVSGASLFLGTSETTIGITDKFKADENQRGLYIRGG